MPRTAENACAVLREKRDLWWEEDTKFFDVRRSRAWVMTRRITHTSHHRGQLMAMLRMLGHDVHSNYGPTADTGGLMQNHAPTIYAYPSLDALFKGEAAGAPKRSCRERLASQSRSGPDDQAEARLRPGIQDRRQALPGRTTVAARPHEGEAPRRWLAQGGRSRVPHCASGSVTIRINGTRSARATPANSARGRRPGNPSCRQPDAGPSHSSTVRTTRNTTMRSPCSSTCERECGDARRPRGPSRDCGGRVDDARHATPRTAASIQRPTYSAVPPRSHSVGATPPRAESRRPLGWHDVSTGGGGERAPN